MNTTKQKSQEMNNDIYYRPPWTCGKYNADKHAAIMFNTIGRSEFFFQKESADVIGTVLQAKKGDMLSVDSISSIHNISQSSILEFFKQLTGIGLLQNTPFNETLKNKFLPEKSETKYLFGDINEYETTAELNYISAANGAASVFNVMFELTYSCSEQCIHCYNPGATRNDNEKEKRNIIGNLSLEEYRRIINELCEEGLVTASLSGGDPFCNKNAWEIIDYLYEKDIAITIFTNGLSLEHQINRLAQYFPREVRISLYSGDYKVHDSITRTPGSWEKTMNIIEQLYNHSVPFSINCPIMKPNLKTYPQVFDIGKQFNVPVIADVQIIDSLDGDTCATNNLRLSPEEMEIVLTDSRISSNIDIAEQKQIVGYKKIECRAGHQSFCIMPDGRIKPCCSFNLIIGDLRKQSFHTITTNNPILDSILNINKDFFEECWKHEYCEYCNFCIANNYNANNTIYKAGENNCFIAKVKYELMKKKLSGIDILNELSFENRLKQFDDYKWITLHQEYKKG